MSGRTRRNLVTIEKNDLIGDLPKSFAENNDAINDALDKIEAEIVKLKEEIRCLRKDLSSQ